MKRDLSRLHGLRFDLLVVGGGVHGACVARDAALRGLSVALIEQQDFNSATSHNSLKTIHGGIRYLQHLNFKRTVESIREQQIMLSTAGQLVKPLDFFMPNHGWGMRSPLAMGIGIAVFESLYRLIGILDRRKHRGFRGRIMSRKTVVRDFPGMDASSLTGGAIWCDAQVTQADKAVLLMLQDAASRGAVVANYLRADSPVLGQSGTRVDGVDATDQLTGEKISIRAQLVVNAAGPWVAQWLDSQPALSARVNLKLVRSMNLVTRLPAPEFAIGVKSERVSDSRIDMAKRLFFVVPWENRAIIGTSHFTHRGNSPEVVADEAEIDSFVDEFSAAYPALGLKKEDVLYCYFGLTPGDDSTDTDGAKLHHSTVVDHGKSDKIEGIVSVIGIKWTTARLIAEHCTDLVMKKLNRSGACRTRSEPLPDEGIIPQVLEGLSDQQIKSFVLTHIEKTQARKLSDIVLRRTNDLVLGRMSVNTLVRVQQVLTDHFDLSPAQQQADWDELLSSGLTGSRKKTLSESAMGKSA